MAVPHHSFELVERRRVFKTGRAAKAQFVELLLREGSHPLKTDEAVMAARQLALESKVKEASQKAQCWFAPGS